VVKPALLEPVLYLSTILEGGKMVKVRELMTKDIVSVPPSAPIIEVAQRMRDSGTGVIPVCNNGEFQGLITERDIVISIVARAHSPKREHARSLVHNHRPIVSPGDEVIQAAKVMVNHGVRALPVAQNGKLLGLFTLDDLARGNLALAAAVLAETAKRASKEVGT
jgi:CBS domain-containing protein